MSTQGERVKEAREAAGLSQTKLAKIAGCTPSNISQIESGKVSEPSASLMFGIERATGFSASWMASGKGPKITNIGGAGDPQAQKLRSIYDAIMTLPLAHQEKIAQDVDFLLSLSRKKGEPE